MLENAPEEMGEEVIEVETTTRQERPATAHKPEPAALPAPTPPRAPAPSGNDKQPTRPPQTPQELAVRLQRFDDRLTAELKLPPGELINLVCADLEVTNIQQVHPDNIPQAVMAAKEAEAELLEQAMDRELHRTQADWGTVCTHAQIEGEELTTSQMRAAYTFLVTLPDHKPAPAPTTPAPAAAATPPAPAADEDPGFEVAF